MLFYNSSLYVREFMSIRFDSLCSHPVVSLVSKKIFSRGETTTGIGDASQFASYGNGNDTNRVSRNDANFFARNRTTSSLRKAEENGNLKNTFKNDWFGRFLPFVER